MGLARAKMSDRPDPLRSPAVRVAGWERRGPNSRLGPPCPGQGVGGQLASRSPESAAPCPGQILGHGARGWPGVYRTRPGIRAGRCRCADQNQAICWPRPNPGYMCIEPRSSLRLQLAHVTSVQVQVLFGTLLYVKQNVGFPGPLPWRLSADLTVV